MNDLLVVVKGLLPERFACYRPTLTGFRQALAVEGVLFALRPIVADHLASLPPPLGFHRPSLDGAKPGKRFQHRAGPDPPR